MPVYQVDYQSRYPYPDNPDGYYYWTNTFYTVNTNDHDAAVSLNGVVTNLYAILCLTGVETLYYQIKTPPGRQAALYVDNLGDTHGLLPENGGGLLTNAVRAYGLIGGRQVWYKRWRVPLRAQDIDGVNIESAFHAYLEVNFAHLASYGVVTTASGDVIEEIHVAREVRMWQLRHGTKRRQRVVFAVP